MAENTFRLTEKESLTIERLSYIYESNKAVAAILARELANAETRTQRKCCARYATPAVRLS